jgi:hypothetical protein
MRYTFLDSPSPVPDSGRMENEPRLNGGQGRNRTTDTRIFKPLTGRPRGLFINHLQRLPAPSPGPPWHIPGSPNLSPTHSRHMT